MRSTAQGAVAPAPGGGDPVRRGVPLAPDAARRRRAGRFDPPQWPVPGAMNRRQTSQVSTLAACARPKYSMDLGGGISGSAGRGVGPAFRRACRKRPDRITGVPHACRLASTQARRRGNPAPEPDGPAARAHTYFKKFRQDPYCGARPPDARTGAGDPRRRLGLSARTAAPARCVRRSSVDRPAAERAQAAICGSARRRSRPAPLRRLGAAAESIRDHVVLIAAGLRRGRFGRRQPGRPTRGPPAPGRSRPRGPAFVDRAARRQTAARPRPRIRGRENPPR